MRPRRCRGDSPAPSRPRPAPPPQSPPGCLSSCSPREPPPQPAAGRHSRLPGPSQGATALSRVRAFARAGQSLAAWPAGRIWLTSLPSGLTRGSLAASGTRLHDPAGAGCSCKDSVVDVTRRRAAMEGDASDSQVRAYSWRFSPGGSHRPAAPFSALESVKRGLGSLEEGAKRRSGTVHLGHAGDGRAGSSWGSVCRSSRFGVSCALKSRARAPACRPLSGAPRGAGVPPGPRLFLPPAGSLVFCSLGGAGAPAAVRFKPFLCRG